MLVPRRRTEYDAGAKEEYGVQHWHQGGQQRMTLALRRMRSKGDAGIEEEESRRGCWPQ